MAQGCCGGGNNNNGGSNGGGGNGSGNGGSGGGNGGNGGGNNNNKTEELQPHPLKEQLPGVQYCVNSPPPWPEAIMLGFQHYLLTLGITVLIPSMLVPKMGGGDIEKARVIQTMLFVSGFNTLFQSLFGTRLPTVVTASYTYVIPTTSILLASRYKDYSDPHEKFFDTMRGIQGALIITASFQMIIGFLGLWRNAIRCLSPLSVVPYITFTGLGVYRLGFPTLARCVELGLPELIVMVFIAQYLPHILNTKKKICDRFAVLFSIPVVWLFAQLLTSSGAYNNKPTTTQLSCRTDRSGLVGAAPWIYIPYPFQWGSPTFNVGEALAMIAASFVSTFEHRVCLENMSIQIIFILIVYLQCLQSTGTFFTTARYGSATPVPPSVVSRGVGWLGIGVLFDGMFGSLTGSAASVENAGLLALTKVGSRRVIQISAGFMIFFSVFAAAGLGFLQFCNLNSFRTKFILGFSFFLGISIPQYFREYYHKGAESSSGWFDDLVTVIFMSHTTVAAMVAMVLDCSLAREDNASRKDSGLYWWEKFSLYGSDIRNDEFYALPCRLNKFFPAL
ncbi:unnamed protein product [Malus baccata var. baccata]